MSAHSPTVADLASAPGASFSFDCRPCGRHKFYAGEELRRFLVRVPAAETLTSLRARMICPQCKMPVDGVFRTFDYSRPAGTAGHGWSGPKA